jgi:hypothetical protein
MGANWIPTGFHDKLGLHVERDQVNTGAFASGRPGIVWHITVSPWMRVDSMASVLHDKRAEPHLLIGGRAGTQRPVVIQFVAFNQFGKAMANLPGGVETNRAGQKIQVEICANPGVSTMGALGIEPDDDDPAAPDYATMATELFAIKGLPLEYLRASLAARASGADLCMHADGEALLLTAFRDGVASWGEDTYAALAGVGVMIDRRVDVPRKIARSFDNPKRFERLDTVTGHFGHMHAPENNHVDPTGAFRGRHLLAAMDRIDPR